jgi:lipopolysaccharide/colanic/teichoic acid biosynthesis glycosyltransferase
MYARFFKRFLDFILSLTALLVLFPILLILALVGAIAMKGNPFFTQRRPGRKGKDGKERIFRLIKFRTMSNAKDENGNLLPDEVRLNKYGKFLRSTSLDELPELFNIFKGDMSIVGPRPLLVEYLPYYTEEERHRHDVRPGLTGLSQIKGRNYVRWEDKFEMDVEYTNNISFVTDILIMIDTVKVIFKRENIETASSIIHDGILYQPLNIERGAKEKEDGLCVQKRM